MLRMVSRGARGSGAGMAERLRPLAVAGLMFLAMRVELLLRASPLAVALMAAGMAAGESAGALVAGCLLGMLRLPLTQIPLLPALSCAGVLSAELALEMLPTVRRGRSKQRYGPGAEVNSVAERAQANERRAMGAEMEETPAARRAQPDGCGSMGGSQESASVKGRIYLNGSAGGHIQPNGSCSTGEESEGNAAAWRAQPEEPAAGQAWKNGDCSVGAEPEGNAAWRAQPDAPDVEQVRREGNFVGRGVQPDVWCALSAGMATLLPPLVAGAGDGLRSLQAFACALVAAFAAPFLRSALSLRPGRARLMFQEKLGLALLGFAALAGLRSLLPPAAEVLAALAVLALPSLGAASGVLAGLALAAGSAGAQNLAMLAAESAGAPTFAALAAGGAGGLPLAAGAGPLKLASLAVCALAADSRICEARWQRALALPLAAVAARLAMGQGALGPIWALCGAVVYLLLPEDALRRFGELFSARKGDAPDPDLLARELTAETGRRLRSLGDAFAEMAEVCPEPSPVPDEQELICQMRERLCAGCAGYADCWAGGDNGAAHMLCRLISEALDCAEAPPGRRVIFSDGEIPPYYLRACHRGKLIPDRLGLLLRDFAEKRRAEIKRCATDRILAAQFVQARELLYDLAERSCGPHTFHGARLEELRAALEAEGLGDCAVYAGGSGLDELALYRAREGWSRDEVRRAGLALSRTLNGRLTPRLRGGALRFVRRARYFADTGASCRPIVAGEPCGDSHLVRSLGGTKLLLMLSDGMGSGESAAGESEEALRLLWRFLDAGIARDLALETVNRQLLTRSGEDIFATLDLCVIDLNTGVAEFTKLAACRTLILREGELMCVEGGQLPLGILENVRPSVRRLRLKAGDTLIMGSDGVMEAGEALSIERCVREHREATPEQLAERLVREATLRRTAHPDDLTCICARIQEADRQAG